jgi:hypothetical protein
VTPRNHAELVDLAKSLRRKLETLYTLSSTNDPWMVGQDYRSKHAYWIADLFQRLQLPRQVHDRQIHYKLISQETPVLQVDGTPYVNNADCYNRLCDAIKDARYLALIPPRMIIDRRNPEPTINFDGDSVGAEIETSHGRVYQSAYGLDCLAPSFSLPSAELDQEPDFGQRYQLEIWIEKRTQNDVLLPLGREYGINIATFVGEVSTTRCEELVDRAIESGRPVRILHVTDFDPAGRDMPISAAMKVDFVAKMSGHDLDIKLEHVALTEEQCIRYRLPRTPIKETETRASGFEARYGEGATELDALEALHPGALRQILVEHIERYRDNDFGKKVENAIKEYEGELDRAATLARARHAESYDAIGRQRNLIQQRFVGVRTEAEEARAAIANPAQASYDAVVQPARAAYEVILEAATRDLDALVRQAGEARDEVIEDAREEIVAMEQPLVAEAETLIGRINDEFDEVVPDPDQFDWPEPVADEWENPLYDSTRDYVEQVDVYRRHRGDDEDVGYAADRIVTGTCALCGESFTYSAATRKRTFRRWSSSSWCWQRPGSETCG